MTKKTIRNNIQILKNLRDSKVGRVPASIQSKINKLTDLYEQRKIVQLSTAQNLINDISTNNTKKREKALEKYEKKIEKYDTAQPAGERMAEQAKKAREARTEKGVVKKVRVRLREKSKASAISRLVKVARDRGIGNRKLYSIKYMLYSLEPIGRIVRGKRINGLIYYPMFEGGRNKEANIRVGEFIETLTNRTVTKQQEKPMFKKLLMFLKTDSGLRDAMPDMLDYVDAIQITQVIRVDDDGNPYNIEDEGLRDTSNVAIYHFYHETVIDPEKET